MTPILASEPITVKRIIFRIQSKNFSKLQFTLSHSLLFPSVYICPARASQQTKNNNKIYVQDCTSCPPPSLLFYLFLSQSFTAPFVIGIGIRAQLISAKLS